MLDLIIVAAFVAYSISSGLRNKKAASKNLTEYFLAGKSLPGWKSGLSMAATQYAADTPLLVAGLIASAGIFALWRLWIYGLAFLMMGFMLSACWRRAGVLTDAELTRIRYSGRGVLTVRTVKALYYGTLINCTVLAMVLVAAVRIAEVFCLWHRWLPDRLYQPISAAVTALNFTLAAPASALPPSIATTNNSITIVLIVLFTTLYSATGGLRSVVATDIIQFCIAMLATLAYAVLAVQAGGGFEGITTKLTALYGDENARQFLSFTPPASAELLWPFVAVIGLQWLYQMNADGTGYLAQRSMGCRSDKDARIAAIVFTIAQIFFRSLVWIPICLALLVIYPIPDGSAGSTGFIAAREITFVTGIRDLLPPGLTGLMLTGMLAAFASTLDTHLNWGAGYWSCDIYRDLICTHITKRSPGSRELVWVARLSNLLIVLIALVIMSQLQSIRQAWHLSLLFGAGIGSVLVLRWIWERINLYSEIAAMVASLLTAPLLLACVDAEWLRLCLMALCSTASVITVTLLTAPTDQATLTSFYTKVQPPGFWRHTARQAGLDPEKPLSRFRSALCNTILAALILFSSLVGITKLFLPIPGQSPLSGLPAITVGLVCSGIWWLIKKRET
ncbi:MAG: Na+:solute symporter [Deltaproteobacteria bacterium]|nr:Na+:solute symporter [Deltaproteobacteria bacterium]